jgi:predicted O-methyltransferase YrrM
MRSVAHWTPPYAAARFREVINHISNPEAPWLTRDSVAVLSKLLRPSDVVVEFGAGRSTRWFARRVAHLTSIESDPDWHTRVLNMLKAEQISNVRLVYIPPDVDEARGADAAYVRAADNFEENTIDVVLVDGIYRSHCALKMVKALRAGGILIIDNANWFLPSNSRSPNSRRLADGPKSDIWVEFAAATDNWRRMWTSSGVTDTLILFRP